MSSFVVGVESLAAIAARIRAALAHLPPERLIPAPDCGMKYLPHDSARAKLMSTGTSMHWGPGVSSKDLAHSTDDTACYTCHTSWTTSCVGRLSWLR